MCLKLFKTSLAAWTSTADPNRGNILRLRGKVKEPALVFCQAEVLEVLEWMAVFVVAGRHVVYELYELYILAGLSRLPSRVRQHKFV